MSATTSKFNFDPKIWGKPAWDFIHMIALSYPTNPTRRDRQTYREFFRLMGQVLPCTVCIDNYAQHWEKYSIDNFLDGPDELFYWTVIVRNAVKHQITPPGFLPKCLYEAKKLKRHYMDLAMKHAVPERPKSTENILMLTFAGVMSLFALMTIK